MTDSTDGQLTMTQVVHGLSTMQIVLMGHANLSCELVKFVIACMHEREHGYIN